MRRRPADHCGAWVDHVWFPDTGSVAYVVAKAAVDERRRVRRARLLALIEAERDGLGEW